MKPDFIQGHQIGWVGYGNEQAIAATHQGQGVVFGSETGCDQVRGMPFVC